MGLSTKCTLCKVFIHTCQRTWAWECWSLVEWRCAYLTNPKDTQAQGFMLFFHRGVFKMNRLLFYVRKVCRVNFCEGIVSFFAFKHLFGGGAEQDRPFYLQSQCDFISIFPMWDLHRRKIWTPDRALHRTHVSCLRYWPIYWHAGSADHEDHTFSGIFFDVQVKDDIPMSLVRLDAVAVSCRHSFDPTSFQRQHASLFCTCKGCIISVLIYTHLIPETK